jgi:hypothetical protein
MRRGKKLFWRVRPIDSNGRTIWIADAHRDNGKRFVGRADEKLTAFMELELGKTCAANRQRRKRDPLAQDDSRVRHGPT